MACVVFVGCRSTGASTPSDRTDTSCAPYVATPPTELTRAVLQTRAGGAVHGLAVSPDGRLAVLGDDGSIRIWDVRSRFQLTSLHARASQYGVVGLAWNAEGSQVAVRDQFAIERIALAGEHTFTKQQFTRPKNRPDGTSLQLSFAQTGSAAAAIGSNSGYVSLALYWSDPATTEPPVEVAVDSPQRLLISPDGKTVLISTGRVESGGVKTELHAVEMPANQSRVVWSQVSRPASLPRPLAIGNGLIAVSMELIMGRVAVAAGMGELVVMDLQGRVLWRLMYKKDDTGRTVDGTPTTAAFHGDLLVVGSADGSVVTYDARTGRLRGMLGALVRPTTKMKLVGAHVVTISQPKQGESSGGHVTAWSLVDGRQVDSVPLVGAKLVGTSGGNPIVYAAQWDRDDKCGSRGRTVVYDRWALGSAERKAAVSACIERLVDLELLDTDRGQAIATLATVDERSERAIVNLVTGATMPLEASENITIQKFSRDGRWVIGEQDYKEHFTKVVWDAITGKRIAAGIDGEIAIAPGSERVVVVGKTISIRDLRTQRELSRSAIAQPGSVAFAEYADAQTFVVAHENRLRVYREGKLLAQGASVGSSTRAMDISADGKTAATLGDDGTVRIWDVATATVKISFAEFADDEWIAYTPGGSYLGSTEVADRLGWVFDNPAEGFRFEQFAARFQEPRLVRQRLDGKPDAATTVTRPPHVELVGVPTITGATARLRVRARAQTRVDHLRAFSEGAPVAEQRVCNAAAEIELVVPLRPGSNRTAIVAYDALGYASNPVVVDLVSTEPVVAKPDVWIVAVGVSSYPQLPAELQLDAADDDARAITRTFEAMRGSTFANVHATTLIDAAATPTAISKALEGLAGMKPQDLAIVFFAGHGAKPSDAGEMVFLTAGARLAPSGDGLTPESLRDAGVNWTAIGAALSKARGRVVVLLDACHSGHVSRKLVVPNEALATGLVRDQRAGAVVFAASKGRQLSYEGGTARALKAVPGEVIRADTNEPHGFFTGALLASLGDRATDRDGDGVLQLSELIDDVTLRVTRASEGKQTPWVARRELVGDFAVAPVVRP